MKISKSKQTYSGGSYVVIYHKEGDEDYRHREGGPAIINYNKDGSIFSEFWYMNGKRHRENGPAFTRYYEDGGVYCESWWISCKLHRENGPAYTLYNKDGSVSGEYWFIDHKLLSEEQINNIKRNLAFNEWLEQELDHENS